MSAARKWKTFEETLWVFRICFDAKIREYVPEAPTFRGVVGKGLIDHLVNSHNKHLEEWTDSIVS
jgi:hypothetical protein